MLGFLPSTSTPQASCRGRGSWEEAGKGSPALKNNHGKE